MLAKKKISTLIYNRYIYNIYIIYSYIYIIYIHQHMHRKGATVPPFTYIMLPIYMYIYIYMYIKICIARRNMHTAGPIFRKLCFQPEKNTLKCSSSYAQARP